MDRQHTSFDGSNLELVEHMPLFYNAPGGKHDPFDYTLSFNEAAKLLFSTPGKPVGRDDYSGGGGNYNCGSYQEEAEYDEEGHVLSSEQKKKKRKEEFEQQNKKFDINHGNFPPNPNHRPLHGNYMGFPKHIAERLDYDELMAVSRHKAGDTCAQLNCWLASFPSGDEKNDHTVMKFVAPFFNLLYRALERIGPQVRSCYRGMACNNKMLKDLKSNWKTKCAKGNIISLQTISSFSTKREVSVGFASGGILFQCAEMESVDIEGGNYNEYEVVPLAPIQFEILASRMEGGLLVIDLKQIFHRQRRFVVPRVGVLANLGQIHLHVEEDSKKINTLRGSASNEDTVLALGGPKNQAFKIRFCEMCGIKVPFGLDNCSCFTAAAKAAKAARKFWICPKCGSTCEGEKCEMCSAPTQEEKKPQGKWDEELAQIKKVVEEPPCSDEKLIQLLEKKRGDVASVLEALWEM